MRPKDHALKRFLRGHIAAGLMKSYMDISAIPKLLRIIAIVSAALQVDGQFDFEAGGLTG